MKRALVALAAVLIILAGCGTAGRAPVPGTVAAPAKLSTQERAAITKVGSAALKTDRAVTLLRASLIVSNAGEDYAALRGFVRGGRLLVNVDSDATSDALSLPSGRLDQAARAYRTYHDAALIYASALGDKYGGANTGDRVTNAQKAVDAALDDYLASVKALNP